MPRHILYLILLCALVAADSACAQARAATATLPANGSHETTTLYMGPLTVDLGPPVLILFAAFCALWAQNTGRNCWLWFFLGLLFSVITIFFLLTKNANDIRRRKIREQLKL